MPMTMKMSPGFASPRAPLGGIETGNKVSQRPVVRQSKLYREKESGNAMKGIFGQDNLQWDTEKQEGVFGGQAVYDAKTQGLTSGAQPSSSTVGRTFEPEYPHPGSTASCDACGTVVNRYYHCVQCQEETGLFDLCAECCGAIYLKNANGVKPQHPTHDYVTHQMQHVAPP